MRGLVAHGAQGFKFHPSLQRFEPNDVRYYPIYEAIAEAGLPTVFHTGQTGIGAGLPGGRGIKLRYSDPMLLDDVAADFPTLTIILAHPSVPWQDSAISMATHKANVYIDLSGWLPKYFPPQLVRAANSLLRDKVLFGSDYPVLSPDRWMASFDHDLDIKPEVRPLIIKDNAIQGARTPLTVRFRDAVSRRPAGPLSLPSRGPVVPCPAPGVSPMFRVRPRVGHP